jgi:hypothetical protein
MASNRNRAGDVSESSSTRVEGRNIVSAPARAIQVERLRVSDSQRSSVASAFRAGRATADREK